MKKIVLTMALIVIAGYAILPALTNDEIIAEFQTMRNGQLAGAADTMELPRKCGLDICVNLLNIRDQIGEALYGQLLIRPDLQAIDTTEHFIIHYATAGADTPYQASVDINPANGIPDFVDSTALIFEYVWSMEVDSLQYPIPPPDGSNGGDSRYDIYILNLPAGYYGVTYPESQVNNRQWTSYIEVDNDFSNIAGYRNRPLEAMKVTAAHEIFHSIHFGLDSYEYDYFNNQARPWWLEATAVWMEEIVYTQVNDYLSYLLYFYNYPHIGLGEFGSSGVSGTHPYASCVWPLYLDKRFGRDVIRQIWLDCAAVAGYNLLPSIDEVLSRPDSNYNSSFEFAFREFTSWNYFTATRADTINKYPEANRWPQIKRRYSFVRSPYDPAGYPMADTILASDSGPQPLAANYIVFRPWRMPGGLRFHFNGDDVSGFTWAVNVLGWKRGGNDSLFMMNTSPGTGEGSLAIRDWSRYDSLVFIPALFGMTAGYNQYGYGFEVYYDSSLTGNVPIFDSLPYLVYVKGGDCAEVNIHATDANGDSIHIYSDSLPEGATLVDSGNGSALLRFCPDSSQAGDFVSISVRAADTGGYDERTLLFAVESLVVVLPSNNVFAEIYPNPIVYSEGETDTIRYFLPDSLKFGKVQIWLFSVAGDKIYEYEEKISDNNPKGPGYHKIPWDCKNSEHNLIAGGIYFIKIKAGDRTGVGKFAVIR